MSDYIAHSRGKWKKHKYIRKEGNRYIYPEDLKKAADAVGKAAYNALGGKYKKQAQSAYNTANRSRKQSEYYRGMGDQANSQYRNSAAGRYDSAKRSAKRAVKRTANNTNTAFSATANHNRQRQQQETIRKNAQRAAQLQSQAERERRTQHERDVANLKKSVYKTEKQRQIRDVKNRVNNRIDKAKSDSNQAVKARANRQRWEEQQRRIRKNSNKATRHRRIKRGRKKVAKYIYNKIAGE